MSWELNVHETIEVGDKVDILYVYRLDQTFFLHMAAMMS